VAGPDDLDITQGDSYEHEYTWVEDGLPVDLTGWTPRATIKRFTTDVDELLVPNVDKDDDESTGIFVLTIDPTDTALLPAGTPSGSYDIQFTHSDGRVKTPVIGAVYVTRDVSQ
jgi:hypothetical protein